MSMQAASTRQIWDWLGQVPDPEIPVISVVDLGIVRDVQWQGDECVVTITPTYSGCPAMQVIAESVTDALREHGIAKVKLVSQLSPAWTTDWMSAEGREKLKGYGIAPPAQQVIDISGLGRGSKKRRQAHRYAQAERDLPQLRLGPHPADQPIRFDPLQGFVQMPGLPRTFRLFQVPLRPSAPPL